MNANEVMHEKYYEVGTGIEWRTMKTVLANDECFDLVEYRTGNQEEWHYGFTAWPDGTDNSSVDVEVIDQETANKLLLEMFGVTVESEDEENNS